MPEAVRIARFALGLAAMLLPPLAIHAAIVAHGRHAGVLAAAIYAAPLAVWIALAWFFGRTLAPGREPLVTAIARICHGPLDPGVARYTRGVTAAWCAFFAATAIALAVLAVVLPLETWSLAANVGAYPLIALMFAAEYGVRRLRFPDFAHVDPVEMVARLGRAGWRGLMGAPR